MATKKNQTKKYPKEHRYMFQKFMTLSNLNSQRDRAIMDQMLLMYQTYINANVPMYTTGCSDCPTSIKVIFLQLRDWWAFNQNEFAI